MSQKVLCFFFFFYLWTLEETAEPHFRTILRSVKVRVTTGAAVSVYLLQGVVVQSEGPELKSRTQVRYFPQSEQAQFSLGQGTVGVLGLGFVDQAKFFLCWDQSFQSLL